MVPDRRGRMTGIIACALSSRSLPLIFPIPVILANSAVRVLQVDREHDVVPAGVSIIAVLVLRAAVGLAPAPCSPATKVIKRPSEHQFTVGELSPEDAEAQPFRDRPNTGPSPSRPGAERSRCDASASRRNLTFSIQRQLHSLATVCDAGPYPDIECAPDATCSLSTDPSDTRIQLRCCDYACPEMARICPEYRLIRNLKLYAARTNMVNNCYSAEQIRCNFFQRRP